MPTSILVFGTENINMIYQDSFGCLFFMPLNRWDFINTVICIKKYVKNKKRVHSPESISLYSDHKRFYDVFYELSISNAEYIKGILYFKG